MGRIDARDEGAARVLAFDNPARKGAVDAGMLAQLEAEARRATADGVRALILTGAGRGTFCAGYDLSALPDTPAAELPDAPLGRACAALEACSAPVIAAIDGAAYGAGFELACACDFRLASPGARFSLPPAKLGLIYSAEGIARVARTLGLQTARTLLLRAVTWTAADAHAAGLVEAPVDDPLAAALSRARELEQLAPQSLSGMKAILNGTAQDPDALRRTAFGSDDAREGRAAFLERRPAKFTGR